MSPSQRPRSAFSWHDANVRKGAVLFRVVQSVSDHELIGNAEPNIVGLDGLFSARWLVEQCGNTQVLRSMAQHNSLQIIERETSVQNVFDEDDVAILHRLIHVLGQLHFARRIPPVLQFMSWAGTVAVARDSNEIERGVELDLARQVAEKNCGAFEDTHQNHSL